VAGDHLERGGFGAETLLNIWHDGLLFDQRGS